MSGFYDNYIVEIMNIRHSILLILLMILVLFYYTNQEGFVDAVVRNCVSKETAEPTFLCQAKEYLSSFISGYNNTNNYKYTCCPVKDGEQGPRGTKGPTGMKGLVGPMGEKGPVGEIGDSKIGPTGAAGPVGPVGKMGLRGVDEDITEVGPVGPEGDAGPPGDVGPVGPPGPDGMAEKNEPVVITAPNDMDDRAMNFVAIRQNIRNLLSSKNVEVAKPSSKSPFLAQGNEYKKSVSSL
jgi:hypothetical protein